MRIAITGAYHEDKSRLVEVAFDLLGIGKPETVSLVKPSPFSISSKHAVVFDPAANWISYWAGFPFGEDAVDDTQIFAAVIRRTWEHEYLSKDYVLSPETGFDEAARQVAEVERVLRKSQTGIQIPGQDVAGLVNRSQASAQVLLNMAEEEIRDYWDFVYLKPAPEDADPLTIHVNAKALELVKGVPEFAKKIKLLPSNLDVAKKALVEELPTWEEKVAG